jgi:uncharacterized membrane protein YedE/YeeE
MAFPLAPEVALQTVLWGAPILGLVLGAAGQASRFCVRGAIADWFVLGSRGRMLAWVLAVAVAAIGSQLLIAAGLFDPTRSIAWSDRLAWLSYLVGGLMFGYGMVLAGGCPQRSLVKLGAGNLRALVTLLVAAVAAQMTLRGVLAVPRVEWLDAWSLQLDRPQDIGNLLSLGLPGSAEVLRALVLVGLCVAAGAWVWRWRKQLSPLQAGGAVAIGLLVPASWWLTGHVGHLPEHPETLEAAWLGTQSRRPEALSFTAPIAHALDLLTLWSDAGTKASFGVLLAAGVIVGSHVSARLRGELRLESFGSVAELRKNLVGSLLMGAGGVAAVGCSVGQGITGLAMLSAGSLLAVAGILAGTVLALNTQPPAIADCEPAGDRVAG